MTISTPERKYTRINPTVCPKCSGPTKQKLSHGRLRYTCTDPYCPFFNGWSLEFVEAATNVEIGSQTKNDMVAVPLDSAGHQRPSEAVVWPPQTPDTRPARRK